MSRSGRDRALPPAWHSAAAWAAFLFLLFLAPVQSAIWHDADAPQSVRALSAIHDVARSLHPVLAFGDDDSMYQTFGRLMFLVYLGTLVGLQTAPISSAQGSARAKTTAIVALLVAAFADIVTYWMAGLDRPQLRFASFWCAEVPALVVVLGALTALGISEWRARGIGLARLLLTAVIPLALIATAIVQYLPHGPMLAIAFVTASLTLGKHRPVPTVNQSPA